MQDKIYEINGIGWYIPLKKILITSKVLGMEVLPEMVLDRVARYESYKNELKELPKTHLELNTLCIKSMGVLLTNQCSLRCIYCFSEAGDKLEETLSIEQIEVLIKTMVKNAVINKKMNLGRETISELTISGGGEPTHDWNKFTFCVEKFKELCVKNGIVPKIKVVTNGCMSDKHADYVIKNIDDINVSFDGTELIQNYQRPLSNGQGSYPIVKRFINKCGEADKKILVRATVLPDNFSKVGDIVDELFEEFENVDCVHVEPMISLGRATNISKGKANKLLDFMFGYIDAVKRVKHKYENRQVVNSLFSYGLTEYFCSASLGTHPWVHMNGKIMPCKDYMSKSEHIVGELDQSGVKFNKEFKPLLYNMAKCKECFAYYHCGGGCSVNMPKDENGECTVGFSREMCSMIKKYWEYVLNILIEEREFGNLKMEELVDDELKNLVNIYRIIT